MYWPVYCPVHKTEVFWYNYTERVRFPYIPGLTACTGPSTARPRPVHKTEVFWYNYTERVRFPYIPGLTACTGPSTALYTRGVLGVY